MTQLVKNHIVKIPHRMFLLVSCLLVLGGIVSCAKKETTDIIASTPPVVKKVKKLPTTQLYVVVENHGFIKADYELMLEGKSKKTGKVKAASADGSRFGRDSFSLSVPRKQQTLSLSSNLANAATELEVKPDAEQMWLLVTLDEQSDDVSDENSAPTYVFDVLVQYEPI
ncbi:MAG: hypothetical protein HKM24_03285 [Gammaproteobacteria bacterium]|nr:hypothetical protein [Gammaproteobacteria bacterium]